MERSPSPIPKKLALKPGQRFLLLDAPAGYEKELAPLPEGVTLTTKTGGKFDAIQLFATTRNCLEEGLSKAKASLNPGGMVWVTDPKGTGNVASEINRDTIRAYVLTAGFDTVALVAIDDDWSAIRLKAV